MEINTKFNIGDKVWGYLGWRDGVSKFVIQEIYIREFNNILLFRYGVQERESGGEHVFDQENLFKTKRGAERRYSFEIFHAEQRLKQEAETRYNNAKKIVEEYEKTQ